jgi:uncharacterized protein DUF4082
MKITRTNNIRGILAGALFLLGVGGVVVANQMASVSAQAANCPCSIWAATDTPSNAAVNSSTGVEVGVKFRADTSGYVTGVRFYKGAGNTGTHTGSLWKADGTKLATGTFTGETASGWQTLTFSQPVPVTPNAIYVASYFAPNGHYAYDTNYFNTQPHTSGPLTALQNGTSGGNGVYSYTGTSTFPKSTYSGTNYWVDVTFNTSLSAPSSPVLVVTNRDYQFSNYYPEILKNEGYNSFDTAAQEDLSATLLAQYGTVVLGEMPLTAGQVTWLTDWVTNGGNLIAMRPDAQLASLLGIQKESGTIANQYLKFDTTKQPGTGLVNQTIQFHGTADKYALSGAESLAELYLSATTASGKPAVTIKSVGSNGGQAAAFTYDLAKSVVYTRQGNPAWAGQNRETVDGITRSDDLFFGNAAGDSQPDWVDMNKVAIPQADEQQRLFTKLLASMQADKMPMPHLWYLPNGMNATVVMTADDHALADAGAQVRNRFERYRQQSNPGCNVALWECIRSSGYFYLNSPMNGTQAQTYHDLGFDLGVHLLVNGSSLVNGVPSSSACGEYNASTIQTYVSQQLAAFNARYPYIPLVSNRTHCISWNDWVSQAKAEANGGIRMDTNYYYWPGDWVQNRPGMMNGGGFPMRFADTNGSLVDTYQAMTNMQDEGPTPQTYPYTIDTLLDNALGPNGYYGVFTANMHSDFTPDKSDAIVNSAKSRGVPVVSARQMLNWIDGRNDTKMTGLTWNGSTLNFNVAVASGAQNLLRGMLPWKQGDKTMQSLRQNGQTVNFEKVTIKGVDYAFFAPVSGAYMAEYGNSVWQAAGPTTAPVNGTSSVELGVKFKSNANGFITGVRFYKDSINTGTHVGSLWTSTGTKLASATFTGESASGWQQVNFATPVAVTAGTTYVASYHSPTGKYAASNNYFSGGVTGAPLYAFANGEQGGNGVYNYSATASTFPTGSYLGSNYWVDVVFRP